MIPEENKTRNFFQVKPGCHGSLACMSLSKQACNELPFLEELHKNFGYVKNFYRKYFYVGFFQ